MSYVIEVKNFGKSLRPSSENQHQEAESKADTKPSEDSRENTLKYTTHDWGEVAEAGNAEYTEDDLKDNEILKVEMFDNSYLLKIETFDIDESKALNYAGNLEEDCKPDVVGIKKISAETDTGQVKMKPNKSSICQCTQCDFTTKTKANIRRHVLYKHTPKDLKWHRCEHCSFRGKCKGQLKRHTSYHHSDDYLIKSLQCDQCCYKAKFKNEIARHQTSVHSGPKLFKCDICSGYFNSLENLRRHFLQQHTPDELIKWNESHSSLKSLVPHSLHDTRNLVIVNENELVKAEPDADNPDENEDNSDPLKIVEIVECPQCPYKIPHTTPPHLNEWFNCDHCSYKSKERRNLKRHILSLHSEDRPVKCTKCDFATKTTHVLKQHMINKHTPEDLKWLSCDYCSYKGKLKQRLQRHILFKHSSEDSIKWLYCDNCSYKTKTKSCLNIHQKNVHNEFQTGLKCNVCDVDFKSQRSLTKHARAKHSSNLDVK